MELRPQKKRIKAGVKWLSVFLIIRKNQNKKLFNHTIRLGLGGEKQIVGKIPGGAQRKDLQILR